MSITVLTFLFTFLLASLCRAQDVTLYLNDTRFSTQPPNWWGGQTYQPLCGGTRWTDTSGESISLTFTGIAITVNFIAATRGAIALVTINGTSIAQISTFKAGVSDTACTPQPWSSGPLPAGQHVITVAQLGPGDPTYTSDVYVWMRSFVYTLPPAASATATSSAPSYPVSKSSVPIGLIAGAAGGGAALLLAIAGGIFVLRRRRRRGRDSLERIDLMTGTGGDKSSALLPLAPAPAFPIPSFPTPSPSGGPVYGHMPSSGASINYNHDPSRISFSSASQRPTIFPGAVPSNTVPYTESLSSGTSSSLYSDATKNQKAPLLDSKTVLHPTNPSFDGPEPQRLTETQLHFLQRLTERNVPGTALATVIQSMTTPNRDPAAAQPGPSMSLQPSSPNDEPPPVYNFKGA